jgi:energy-coupling factor transport system permease protein
MDFFKRISFNRYIDTGSPIHSLDPRTKLITLIIISVLTFYAADSSPDGALTLLALLTVSFLIIPLAGINIGYVVKCIFKFAWFFLIIIIFHSLYTPGRVIPVFSSYGIIVTHEGVVHSVWLVTKLYIVIQYTYIFILTTSPLEMTNAIKKLLSFLKIFKVPVEDLAIMIMIAIKFIPTFFKEIQKITAAQKARGVVFNEGSVRKRVKAVSLIITPVFYNIFKWADELNTAMICRGYRAGRKRSSYKNIRFRVKDYLVLIAASTLLVINIV